MPEAAHFPEELPHTSEQTWFRHRQVADSHAVHHEIGSKSKHVTAGTRKFGTLNASLRWISNLTANQSITFTVFDRDANRRPTDCQCQERSL